MALKKYPGLASILGFNPGETIIEWIDEHYTDQGFEYEDVAKKFNLESEPNYYTGIIFSAFDLLGVPQNSSKPLNIPPLSLSETRAHGNSSGSFLNEYISVISDFPTLSREEEVELSKSMEIAYIRYKNSLYYCPLIIDWLYRKISEIDRNEFDLIKFKALVVPGANNISYPDLWTIFKHTWDKVMAIRESIRSLNDQVQQSESPKKDDLVLLGMSKFAISFLLKDLNIKESVFHEIRSKILEERLRVARFKKDIQRIRKYYDEYIELKNLMVNYNLKLVISIAKKFFKSNVPPMDIIQYGNEGLIRATEDYNYKLKFKFSTYAIWWIRQKIQEGAQEKERLIRIPAYRLHLSRKYSAIKERINNEDNRLASDKELSKEMNLSLEQVERLRRDPKAFTMAQNSAEDDYRENSLEQIVDRRSLHEEKTFDEDALQALKIHLKIYPSRERFILHLRFGILCEDISPENHLNEDVEISFEKHANLNDQELDDTIPPIPYTFKQLATEVEVPLDALKIYKKDKKMKVSLIQKILPHQKGEIGLIHAKSKQKENLSSREGTLLALSKGIDCNKYLKLKPKGRIVFNGLWVNKNLPASVARKIYKRQGLTLEEVANIFGLSKERVRQIESEVIENISYHLTLP